MNNLVNIILDGQTIQAEKGANLIDVARDHGVHIPTLCYLKKHDPLATCRICTVKVNGRNTTGCTVKVDDNMDIQVQTPALLENRKAIIEMLYAEGNHFCPSCEKSGNCEMQNLGYLMGITNTRYPHVFRNKEVDFTPHRIIMDANRCILCKRCVEEIKTYDGKSVFAFIKRGNLTRVQIDYHEEHKLTDNEALKAMNTCPVGAILVKGLAHEKPFGDRKYDFLNKDIQVKLNNKKFYLKKGEKFRVATTSLAGCFGCHMSLLDIDEELLEMIEIVTFHKSPLTDIKKFEKKCHIGLVEGGCANNENVHVLQAFRENCEILISFGECSIMGGIPAMRNFVPLKETLEEAYLNGLTTVIGADVIPDHEDIPKLLDKVYPINEVVSVDYYIPGCPPNAQHIWKVVKSILLGKEIPISYEEFKYD